MWKIAIFLILQIFSSKLNATLSVKSLSIFPFPVNTPFELKIIPITKTENVSKSSLDTMVIGIIGENDVVMERATFYYGKDDSINEDFNGKFMEIPIWEKDQSLKFIKINILFKRGAHRNKMEIYLFHVSKKERKNILKNLKLAKRIYSSNIDLLVPSKLELSVKSVHGNNDELKAGELSIATCRAYDGIPNGIPTFQNYRKFNVKNFTLIEEKNERKMWFQVSLSDHSKVLSCKVGETVQSHVIKVLHHPTKIFINPEIVKTVELGTTITCFTKDGYPTADVKWHLIKGPENAAKLYKITNNGTQLQVSDGNSTEFTWTFLCSAKSIIQGFQNIINKTISFKVEKTISKHCNSDCLNLRILKMEKMYEDQNKWIKREILNWKNHNKTITEQLKQIYDNINQYNDILNNKIKKQEVNFQNQFNLIEQKNYEQSIEFKQYKMHIEIITSNKMKEMLKKSIEKLEKIIDKIKKNKSLEVDVLKNTMKEINSSIEIIGKKQDIKINNLKNHIVKEQQIMKNGIDILKLLIPNTTIIPRTTISSLTYEKYAIQWVIDEISAKRNNSQNLISKDYFLKDSYNVNFRIWFRDLFSNNLLKEIEIYLSFSGKNNELIESTLSINMTIELVNIKFSQYSKILTKTFTIKNNYDTTPSFYFNYKDLLNSGVLLNDSVTLNCLIIIY